MGIEVTYLNISSVAQSCTTLCNPWTAARQASLSITNSRSLLRLISIELVMPSNHLILCHPLLSRLQSFFASDGQSIGASASASVFPVNIQDWFPLGLTGLNSLQSRGLWGVFSDTTVQSINSSVLSFVYSPTLTSVDDYWKNHTFDEMDLCWQSNVSAC